MSWQIAGDPTYHTLVSTVLKSGGSPFRVFSDERIAQRRRMRGDSTLRGWEASLSHSGRGGSSCDASSPIWFGGGRHPSDLQCLGILRSYGDQLEGGSDWDRYLPVCEPGLVHLSFLAFFWLALRTLTFGFRYGL